MSVAIATKANDLLEALMEAIASETALSEFEQAYYKKEAEKLPNGAHSHLVLSLLYTSLRRQKSAVVHALESIRLSEPGDYVPYANAIWAMNYVGAAKSLYELITQVDFKALPQLILKNILVASHFYNDYELTKRILSAIPEDESYSVEQAHLAYKLRNLEAAQSSFNLTSKELLDISLHAAEIVETLDTAIPVNSKTYILPETNHLSVVFEVECAPENIFDLNWELSCKLVESEIDTAKVVARFDLAERKAGLVSGGVA